MPSNPYNTFIKLWINGKEFCNDENHIMDMKVDLISPKRNKGLGSKATITVYDETSILVENALLSMSPTAKKFKFQYGYVGGEASEICECMLISYGSQFTAKGITLTLEGQVVSSLEALKKQIKPITKSYEGKISDVVKQLANENGWIIDTVIETTPLKDNDGNEIYLCDNVSPIDFINKTLLKLARSNDSNYKGNYLFNIQPKNGKDHIVFQPSDYKSSVQKEKNTNFFVGKPNDVVITFEPDYAQFAYALLGGKGTTTVGNNKQSGEAVSYDSLANGVLGNSSNDTIKLDGNSYSPADIDAIAKNMYAKMQHACYPATLETIGILNLCPFDYINISVLLPNNVLHHSSGKYLIMHITQTINGGTFTSTFELMRNISVSEAIKLDNNTNSNNTNYGTNKNMGNYGDKKIIGDGSMNADYEAMTYIGPRGVPYGKQELYDSLHPEGATAVDRMRDLEGKIPHMSYDGTNCMRTISIALGDTPYAGVVNTDTAQAIAKKNNEWMPYNESNLEPGDTIIVNGGHAIMWTGNGVIQNGWSKNGVYEATGVSPEQFHGTADSSWCIIKTSKYNNQ